MLTHGIPPDFPGGDIHICRPSPSGQFRVYRVTQLRTDRVHCQQSIGTGPVVLKVVRGPGADFSGIHHHGPINMCPSLFTHPPTIGMKWTSVIQKVLVSEAYRVQGSVFCDVENTSPNTALAPRCHNVMIIPVIGTIHTQYNSSAIAVSVPVGCARNRNSCPCT